MTWSYKIRLGPSYEYLYTFLSVFTFELNEYKTWI